MSSPRLLIIDDDHAFLETLPELVRLRLPQVTVETSASATAALEQIQAINYHAIVCDLTMPKWTGLCCCVR